MNAIVRVLVPVLATLSASPAFSDVRPVPGAGSGPVVVPVPVPGHGPGRGPGYPHPHPGPGYPQPGPGYPQPYPAPQLEHFSCRELRGGYDYINLTPSHHGRAEFRADVNALGVYGVNLRAFVGRRVNDTLLIQIPTSYGTAQLTIGYINHPYGPTAVFSLAGSYEEFRCTRTVSPAPYPQPYPPSPYPPRPYP